MNSKVIPTILIAWPAFAFHVGINQSGVEFGNKWKNGLESNIYSHASLIHREKPVDNISEISIGVNGSIRVFKEYATELKCGSAFDYRVLKFSGEITSEKDEFAEARLLFMAIEYAANEKVSLTFDSVAYSLRFGRSFEYSGYFLGGIRPRIGFRYNI